MGHIVLLGDSIFDNARYVPGGPAVIDHLRAVLPGGWRATLLAVDGAVAAGVPGQLARLPADATDLVVSAGGNDALASARVLREPARTVEDALTRLAEAVAGFRRSYRATLEAVAAAGLPVVVCTVYDAVPGLGPAERAGLALYNDVILREAVRAGADVIDLRHVCTAAADYAASSPIEPSAAGGARIAAAVVRAVAGDPPPGVRVSA